ncbi:hypothetical protein CEXT_285121 [Caerostris extrusa]|uniref:Uncharacterized protein n=1 Tax=Caerostris extrusa TaxID=172846 RepID=A0AAV4V9G1_CAEEX|nr:hypothetical protein CEXT_285121 [Caerostris extrusa]
MTRPWRQSGPLWLFTGRQGLKRCAKSAIMTSSTVPLAHWLVAGREVALSCQTIDQGWTWQFSGWCCPVTEAVL